ncbi:Phosphoglucomutase-1, partial [Fragariocoptes setiger]
MIHQPSVEIVRMSTSPYKDQKPGTSGLRKKVKVFQQDNYTENFIQSTLLAAGNPKTLVVGGDGRYFSKEAINITANICAANGVDKMFVALDGILSTPAASCLIRKFGLDGGILMTASHNPGGPSEDFGIKYNSNNGGPAPPSITDKISTIASTLDEYYTIKPAIKLDLSCLDIKEFKVHDGITMRWFSVVIINPLDYYTQLMKEIFDFDMIKSQLFGKSRVTPFRMSIDCMHGVMGPFARRILVDELGAPASSVVNDIPKEDFSGKHPDPNLTYAPDLVSKLRSDPHIEFGAAFDGDGDRCMVLGPSGFFVTPSDSLAVMANFIDQIPYYSSNLAGFSRSMPTAPAVDRVAAAKGLKVYETATGWKFFGNLLDQAFISLCGEESFGAGSSHLREKDGLWTVMMWLNIIAITECNVKQIVIKHWTQYGRDYFLRYDYENCDAEQGERLMDHLQQLIKDQSIVGKRCLCGDVEYEVESIDNFSYYDPIDGSVAKDQGVRIFFKTGERVVFRLSGTGSSGATIRGYFSSYRAEHVIGDPEKVLSPVIKMGLKISKLEEFTGRSKPTVIT